MEDPQLTGMEKMVKLMYPQVDTIQFASRTPDLVYYWVKVDGQDADLGESLRLMSKDPTIPDWANNRAVVILNPMVEKMCYLTLSKVSCRCCKGNASNH